MNLANSYNLRYVGLVDELLAMLAAEKDYPCLQAYATHALRLTPGISRKNARKSVSVRPQSRSSRSLVQKMPIGTLNCFKTPKNHSFSGFFHFTSSGR